MQQATGSVIGRKWGFQLGLSSKNLFHHKEERVSGLTHGDDFVLTGPTRRLMEFEKEMMSVYPIKAKKESCTSMIPDTSMCL